MNAVKEKAYYFTNRQLATLIIPLIIEQILGITVGMCDSIMISTAGEAAVSGVSLVDTINILLINTFASLSTGGAVVAAHRLGEKKDKEASKTADQLLVCVTGIAIMIMLVALVGNQFILHSIFGNVEYAVMKNARVFFYMTALSFPFLGIYNACAALSRAIGNSKITMEVSLLMNIINITGNVIFLYGFHMGIYGVSTSTLIARIAGAGLMMKVMRDQNQRLHLSRKISLKLSKSTVFQIMKIGIPTGLDNCIFQVGKILVQSLVTGFGTTAITANAIVGAVAGVAVIPASAIGIAMITVVGQTAGSGEIEQTKYYMKKLMLFAYTGMILLNILIIMFAPQILTLYHVTRNSTRLAIQVIILHSICAMLFWPTGFALPNALRATYDATFTMVISIGSMWLCRIGFSYLLGVYFHMGLAGIWLAMGVDWVFRSACFIVRIKSGAWLKHLSSGQ